LLDIAHFPIGMRHKTPDMIHIITSQMRKAAQNPHRRSLRQHSLKYKRHCCFCSQYDGIRRKIVIERAGCLKDWPKRYRMYESLTEQGVYFCISISTD
ncbi:MAG: hypothetical protein E6562_05615, partial [Pantoea sp.]|uniref:hypothetical protein n=1 Tax=Pantoea sp. TaxID=69393 RepID=UPI00290C3977